MASQLQSPKRSGRPTSDNPHDERVVVYMTKRQLEQLDEIARHEGLSRAATFRRILIRASSMESSHA